MKNQISLARICSIHIKGMKNVRDGFLTFYSEKELKNDSYAAMGSHVFGIYGPNGTGKTSVIDAGWIVQILMSGPFPDDVDYTNLKHELKKYINSSSKSLEISIVLFLIVKDLPRFYEYTVVFDNQGSDPVIQSETLKVKLSSESGEWNRWKKLFSYSDPNPSDKAEHKSSSPEILTIQIGTLKKAAPLTSVLFNTLFFEIISELDRYKELCESIQILKTFTSHYMVVVGASDLNSVSDEIIPLILAAESTDVSLHGKYPLLSLEKSISTIPEEMFEPFQEVFDQINIILETLVPGTKLELRNIEHIRQENGIRIIQYECISVRGEDQFSLCCESEGIKRLISLINALVTFFGNPSCCLLVDEFDAGIFEYLFGILLESLDTGGKGQLIFTAHNLRGLERLPYKQVLFSTTNPDNRFERQTVMENNNNRTTYFRNLVLGKEKGENLGDLPKISLLRNAFRKANRTHGKT